MEALLFCFVLYLSAIFESPVYQTGFRTLMLHRDVIEFSMRTLSIKQSVDLLGQLLVVVLLEITDDVIVSGLHLMAFWRRAYFGTTLRV